MWGWKIFPKRWIAPATASPSASSFLAIIVGSSLIINLGRGPFLYGFSALGIIGFFIAGLLGLWLAVFILRSGRL
jgi:hypothetical protein